MKSYCDRKGIKIDEANSGKHCLELLTRRRQNKYKLLFIDINMPDMTGIEVLSFCSLEIGYPENFGVEQTKPNHIFDWWSNG